MEIKTESELIRDIRVAFKNRRLTSPFRAGDVKRACPGWSDHTYTTFLAKHGGNPKYKQHFWRVSRGLYELLDSTTVAEEETMEILKDKRLLTQIKEAEEDWNKGAYKKGDYLEWDTAKGNV